MNANGVDTHYYFEYVDAADYDASAPDPYSAGTQIPVPPGTDIGVELRRSPGERESDRADRVDDVSFSGGCEQFAGDDGWA